MPGMADTEDMNTTKTTARTIDTTAAAYRPDGSRKDGMCYACGRRRPGGRDHLGMCVPCYDWSGAENEHSDYGHENPEHQPGGVNGCPICEGHPDPATYDGPRHTGRKPAAPTTVAKDGTAACGACHVVLPVTKFPTRKTADGYVRDTRTCRTCRKGGATTPAPKAARVAPSAATRAKARAATTRTPGTRTRGEAAARDCAAPGCQNRCYGRPGATCRECIGAAKPGHPGHDDLARRMFADAFRTAAMIRPRAERVA